MLINAVCKRYDRMLLPCFKALGARRAAPKKAAKSAKKIG
jgi:hypothetical protein